MCIKINIAVIDLFSCTKIVYRFATEVIQNNMLVRKKDFTYVIAPCSTVPSGLF